MRQNEVPVGVASMTSNKRIKQLYRSLEEVTPWAYLGNIVLDPSSYLDGI